MKKKIMIFCLLLAFQSIESYTSSWDIYNLMGQLVLDKFEASRIYYIDEIRIVAGNHNSITIHTGYNYSDRRIINGISVRSNSKFHSNRMSVYDPRTLKLGFIDTDGQIIIPMEFDYVEDFVGNYAIFGCGDTSGPPPYSLIYGLMNNFGEIIHECRYGEIQILEGNENLIYIAKEGSEQFIVQGGKIQAHTIHLPDQLRAILTKVNDLKLIPYFFDGRYGYFDYNGNVVLDPIFTTIISSSYNKILATNERNERFIFDISNSESKDADNAIWLLDNDKILIISGNKQGILSNDGKILVKPIYDSIFNITDNVYVVKDSSNYGVLISSPSYSIRKGYSSFYLNADSEYFALQLK